MAPPARSTNADRRRLSSRKKLPAAGPMSMHNITPIIRIVQVNAPRLICTDVTNFRTLVQEMTGNVQSKYISSPCKQEEQNSCSTTKSNTTQNTVHNELEASGETADCANILIRATTASSSMRRRRRRSRSRKSCSRAAVASSSMHGSSWLHRGAAGAAKAESEHNIDDDDGDEDEDLSCESPAASAVSSCEGSILRPDAAGYNYYNQSEAVEGFLADHDHEPNAETRGYSSNNYCSAYLPLDWRPATHYEIPGGFDYFSF